MPTDERGFFGLNKSRHSAGMTLAEILVVLAIITTVAGMVAFAVGNAYKKQQAKACLTNMLMIEAYHS